MSCSTTQEILAEKIISIHCRSSVYETMLHALNTEKLFWEGVMVARRERIGASATMLIKEISDLELKFHAIYINAAELNSHILTLWTTLHLARE